MRVPTNTGRGVVWVDHPAHRTTHNNPGEHKMSHPVYRVKIKLERPFGIYAASHTELMTEVLLVIDEFPGVALTCSEIMAGLGEANTIRNHDKIADVLYTLYCCGFLDIWRLGWCPNGENEFETTGYIRAGKTPQPVRRFEAYVCYGAV